MTGRSFRRAAWCSAIASMSAAAVVSPAHAQSLRPHILFIFDTSGSMAENAAGTAEGEGSNTCPNNGGATNGTTSRIYNLKAALRAALAQAGTDEANFGLMSFPQTVSNTYQVATCSTGHYRTSAAQTVTTTNRPTTGNHNATAFPGGCLMSTNVANEMTFGTWFTNGAAQVLRVGVTTAAPGVTPVAANYDPPDANIAAIYSWIDNVELPTANGAVTDPELHAAGNTPLGRSLFYARMYFDGMVKPNDPRASCRQNVVVLVTDGADTCDEATAPDNTFSLTTCSGGVAFEPYHPVAQACQLFRTSGIKMYMITDNGLSATDLAAADRIANAGGTGAAIRVSLSDANAAKAAIAGIIASTVPPSEICNGLDDNCNGQIDEGVKNACPLDLVTLKHCAVEIPNCIDDNCNGLVDEGFPQNACGTGAVNCPVPPEICDGIDNNCDGNIDEGFDVGGSCNNGLTGTCRRIGIKECTTDHTGVTCNLSGAPVVTEVCNGIDDDCDGNIDNGLGPAQGVGVDCGIQGQGCSKGLTVCVNGHIICNSVSNPVTETCNGKDDDCNGIIDDGTFPGVGDSCVCPGLDPAQVGVGVCRGGHLACKGASGIQCDGCVFPQPEICDGKDNDCDGTIDTATTCPSGFGCKDGSCALLCRAGEFACPAGYDCVNSYCVPNRCRNVSCAADQKCDNDTGGCVDLCYKVTCSIAGQSCIHGTCYDCSTNATLACAAGQACVNHQCVVDQCANLHCSSDEYCAAGKCVPLSCGDCGPNSRCVGGQCTPYNCAGVVCAPTTEYCDYATGTCMGNMCAAKTCAFCAQSTGECTTDPCAGVACPSTGCWSCEVTPDGHPFCQLSSSCGYVRSVAGNTGGGCACDVSGERVSPGFAFLFVLGFALVIARRRRVR